MTKYLKVKDWLWVLGVVFLGDIAVISMAHAELVDRTEVVVNRQVITWRQLQVEARLQAVMDREIRSWMEPLSEEYLDRIQDRLVDRALLLQEASRLRVMVEDELAVEEEFQRLKKQFPVEKDWEAFLKTYDLDLQEVRRIAQERLVVRSFLETRVTPLFRLSAEEVNDYLREKASGKTLTEEEKTKLQEELYNQRYGEWIEQWMDRLRNRSKIERLH